jgi:hypothetical protein
MVVLVMLLLVLAVEAFAQGQPGAAGPAPGAPAAGGRVRGGDGAFRGMGGMMPQPTPVMMTFQDYIFVVLGNVMYKIDPKEMKVVGVAVLTPPGMMITGQGATPLPPPPPAGGG